MKYAFKDAYRGMWNDAHINQATEHSKRNGATWNNAESRHLLAGCLLEGLGIPQLAKRHHRGVLGVTIQLSRLMDNAKLKDQLMAELKTFEMAEQKAAVSGQRNPYQEELDAICADVLNRAFNSQPCKGMNCGTTIGEHSLECQAEHAAAIAGGKFVKNEFKQKRYAVLSRGDTVVISNPSDKDRPNLELTFKGERLISAVLLK